MSRYLRQNTLASFGPEGTQKLRAARILVVGAGGLAAPVLQYLVGAGLSEIHLVDDDQVSQSNLHRQTLFRETDIGQLKVKAVAAHMQGLNPETQIITHATRLDPGNAAQLISDTDLVLDCADSFAASYILSDACLAAQVPLISASVVGQEGYCGGFCAMAPSLRALFPDMPTQLGSCDADGVLGPTVGIIGSLQAEMALAVLTDAAPSPLGLLVRYDAREMRFSQFRFDKAPEPELAHRFIIPAAISEADHVIDLREVEEPGPKIKADQCSSLAALRDTGLAEVAKDQRIVLACRSGLRAWLAADALAERGYQNLALLALGSLPDISKERT